MESSHHHVQVQDIFKNKNINIKKAGKNFSIPIKKSVILSNYGFNAHVVFSASEVFGKFIKFWGY